MISKIALIGMPNVGKTALFNKLTGSFQRVANFPGVTVEKKSGWFIENGKRLFEVIDLPGIYSLDATTLDEKVTKDFLLKKTDVDLFVLVLDATNLDKSLFLALQLKSIGLPMLLALNLMDEAEKRHFKMDLEKFHHLMDLEIVPTSAASGRGLEELKEAIKKFKSMGTSAQVPTQKELRSPSYVNGVFKKIDQILSEITISPLRPDTLSERIDHFVLHPIWGIVILFSVLIVMFQTLFSWATPLQDLLNWLFETFGLFISSHVSHPLIKGLLVDGIIHGVGGVLVFLPQILLLFLFIQVLEDLGYLGRAAFMMDAFMRRIGLPGKSVIPLLSSHACAIPGILSTRVIDNDRERLITMLVIPLTTCSARLPVYAILTAALIPNEPFLGISWLRLPGLFLFGLYLLGFFSALVASLVFKKSLPHSSPSMLLMELPPYRIPQIRNVFLSMLNKAKMFLKKAGGVILVVSMVIWILVTFPRQGEATQIDHSYAATIGKVFEPVFRPLGFDWRITTALVPSIAAREVMVGALSTVLSVEGDKTGDLAASLTEKFGRGTLVALLIWFVFAPQCISTFAVMKRETNSLKWPLLMVGYTLALAYTFAWTAKSLVSFLS